MKNPLTPAGIEPATFRFVAQYLNHCATAVPEQKERTKKHRNVQKLSFTVSYQELVCSKYVRVTQTALLINRLAAVFALFLL